MTHKTPHLKIWEKISLLLGVLAVLLIGWDLGGYSGRSGWPVVSAQGLNNNASSGAQLFCKRDFSNFIVNGIDFDGEGFTDYWRDILVIYNNNYCQFADIDSLLNRIDKARKQLRQAFYVCDNNTAQRVAAQYYQMSAELYYLRHFVDTAASVKPEYSDAEKAQKVQLRADVRAKFMEKFVNQLKYFSAEDGERVFQNIRAKYESKMESYMNCRDPNFEQLWDRIQNLKGTLNSVEQLGKNFVDRTKRKFSQMAKRISENPGLLTVFSSTGLGDFAGRVASFRINNEPLQESTIWEQISNTAKENAPFTYGDKKALPPAITFDFIGDELRTIAKREEARDLDIRYLTEYDLKYRQVGGVGLDTLKENLDELRRLIRSTFDPMNKVKVCTANIVGKQCGG